MIDIYSTSMYKRFFWFFSFM